MKASILIIGKEILLGERRDENVPVLARYLSERGYTVTDVRVTGDEESAIRRALRSMKTDLVITSGGLGPTRDDRTVEALRKEIGFRGASKLHNPAGKAPGLLIKREKRTFIALPGVPRELRAILDQSLDVGARRAKRVSIGVAGLKETDVENALLDLPEFDRGEVSILPSAELVYLMTENLTLAETIRMRLGAHVFTDTGETLEAAVVRVLGDKSLTVGVAESCTGGGLGETITRVPGSSAVFQGGVIAYSNDAKRNLLGVSSLYKGAVSKDVAIEMARGARKKFNADFGISITGIAGPGGGTRAKPVGTVWIAIAGKRESAKHFLFNGEREHIRLRAVRTALNMLRTSL